ncbi:hypothetical protein [Albirhodobacter sp. R86504]|uniref:hypothetical protein n=1 Tax=Albirhodobacter sp. R86504 TaxID=3093848 RepID=UPI0036721F48
MSDVTRDDLRASVAAGHLSEAQAASVLALAQARAGKRIVEDEPFELFKGFAEIFVSVGLVILITAIGGLTALFGFPLVLVLGLAAATWGLAKYFTLKRRMMLPSIVLVTAFAALLAALSTQVLIKALPSDTNVTIPALLILAGVGGGLVMWYRTFRVPFTMFLIGVVGLIAALVITGHFATLNGVSLRGMQLDLRTGASTAIGTLLFGIGALIGGLWFDMRDPHRLGLTSASGFWLHLLAAPALVNTVALTFYKMGPGLGYALLGVALLLVSVLALVIDRRSFLTAGIGYLIFLLSYAISDRSDPRSWLDVLLIVGLFLTLLGTFWTDLRARLMRGLPDFPLKDRLPPYSTAPVAPQTGV